MDEQSEEELLLHVAAGTDLPTAFAALPRDNEVSDVQSSTRGSSVGKIVWILVAIIGFIAWLLMW